MYSAHPVISELLTSLEKKVSAKQRPNPNNVNLALFEKVKQCQRDVVSKQRQLEVVWNQTTST